MVQKAQYKPELAEAAQEAIGDLSISKVAYKTGMAYESARKLVKMGHVPSEDMLERFAEGIPGADLRKLRIAAGYEKPRETIEAVEYALQATDDLSDLAKQQLMDIVRDFAEKHREK